MAKDRYLVKSYGDNIDGTRNGIRAMIQLLESYTSAMIVVPTIGQVKHTMLTTVLGDDLSKQLIKDRIIHFDGKTIGLCGQKTLRNHTNCDIYLDLWGSEFSIKEIEKLSHCKAIILVTWIPKDSEYWLEKYNPQIIYDDEKGGN